MALNTAEERKWNRLADHMSGFHEWFKREFNDLYELADGSFSKRGMNLGLYLQSARQFYHHLTTHHTIEERFFFPMLAKRMPEFGQDNDHGHIESHKGIHDGLDKLSALIQKWKTDPTSYSPDEMRACLDGFRGVLFSHLDEEVRDLGAENMKKYWTLQEVERLMI